MEYFLIAISFLASLAFALALRRLDRPAGRGNNLRRLGELQEHNLDAVAARHVQSIRDASLEFELLLRQSRQTQEELRETYEGYRHALESLRSERETVETISGELGRIAGSARQVGEQVQGLDRGLERLQEARDEIDRLHADLDHFAAAISGRLEEADQDLHDTVERLVRETEDRTRQLADNARSAFQILQEDQRKLGERMADQARDVELSSERVATLSARLDEQWISEAGRVDERAQELERRLLDRLNGLDLRLQEMRTSATESMQTDIARIRNDLDDFNLAALSRRDEILNETRRMAEGMQDKVNLFQEKYLSAENRLIKEAEEHHAALDQKYRGFEKVFLAEQERRLSELQTQIDETTAALATIEQKEREAIQGAGQNQRDGIKREARELSAALEKEALESEERLRSAAREEERRSQQQREETEDLRERLTILGQEIKATLRSEAEHNVTLLRDARKAEEERIERARTDLQNAIESVQSRADRFVEEQDERIARLGETIDQKINHQLLLMADRGQLQISELEKRTGAALEDSARRMERELDDVRKLQEDFLSEVDQHRLRLDRFQERLLAAEKAQQLVEQLDQTIETLSDRLALAREENSRIDEYVKNFESLRMSRKEIESELRALEGQRDRLMAAEQSFFELERQIDGVDQRLGAVRQAEDLARQIDKRVHQFNEFKDSFEKYYGELGERRQFVEKSLQRMEQAHKQSVQSAEEAQRLLASVDRADHRQSDLQQGLAELEARINGLNRMEKKIELVESRFEQMEGLFADLGEKQRQIGAMAGRVEEMRLSGEEVGKELGSLIQEADEKMDRLAALYHTVESAVDQSLHATEAPAEGPRRKRSPAAASVADQKRNGILSLYINHKWDPELIAERLRIDPAIVRTVIASHNKSS
ncbi:MAG: hypothetical protein K1X75_03610 [Leptospirales bacterium]|nr:hypothetical protein [Leptospirales bacterium]